MRKLFKKAALISGLTFSSRILGVVRDALIAAFFGTSIQSDSFFIAFRPFDLLRKLFSEGILSTSFVPLFSKTRQDKGVSKAAAMVFSFFCFLSLIGVILIIACIIFSPFILKLIAPGFAVSSYQYSLTGLLFKIMLPYFWFIFITALCMGVLNSFDNFGIPALTPVIFNLTIITFTLVICRFLNTPIIGLAVGVTIGGMLQLCVQIPYMKQLGMLKASLSNFFQPEVLTAVKIMVPCMIGAASYQINIMVASFFASTLAHGSVSFIYYADRMVQFPLALFAVSTATVFLPELSTKAASGKLNEISVVFTDSVKLIVFIIIPSMAGLMALDEAVIAFIFGYGAFTMAAIQNTADCLFILVLGLWAFSGVRLFVTLYYALSSIKIPFYSGMISIGLNIVLCCILLETFGLKGLVGAVSISSVSGCIFLFVNLPRHVKIDKYEIIVSACRALFLSVIMYFLVKLAAGLVLTAATNKVWFGFGVLGCICWGVIIYFAGSILISSPELAILKKALKKE